jgi:predicted dehydrogenase
MNVGIIGCGSIGLKRVNALGEHRLVVACDKDVQRAQNVCSIARSGKAVTDWKEAAGCPDADIIIVATTNDWLTPIGLYALEHGKHVLVEKPGARSAEEILPFVKKAKTTDRKIKVGFNLRYHPALIKAMEIASSGKAGELMFVRGRYGHGGRSGYETEWRADPEVCGGGELIDQGVHLIDLSRWFMGEFKSVKGFNHTYYWNMPVDDNAFILLLGDKKQAAWLHVSCTEWKNMFSFEIYGKFGKLVIEGLGGSYGTEKLTYYQMLPQMGIPETTSWEFPGEDLSWKQEFEAFVESINTNKPLNGDISDAYEALKIVNKLYKNSS